MIYVLNVSYLPFTIRTEKNLSCVPGLVLLQNLIHVFLPNRCAKVFSFLFFWIFFLPPFFFLFFSF